ncbi:MAG: curved DNA-binding protein [Acidimicrobiaceae bacterium]
MFSPTGARSHYEVLGVSARAGSDEVRRAYLDRAREAHPDRHIDADRVQRADAERRMQEVNEAWRVLGNSRRRRRYDLERAPETMFASRSDGTMPHDHLADANTFDEIDGTTRLIRGLPWMILVFVLFAIFVFTAYAATGGNKATPIPSNNLARCVAVASGPKVAPAPCESPGARLVVAEVDTNQQCPLGSERLQPITGSIVYCLEV